MHDRSPLPALLDAIDKAGLAEADAEAWKRWVCALVAGDQAEQEQPASNKTGFTQQQASAT